MSFKRFDKTSVRSKSPKVSFWKTGAISLNVAAVKAWNLEKYRCAILYFDAETKRIGIQFTVKEEGFRLNEEKSGARWIHSKSFLRKCDLWWMAEQRIHLKAEWDDREKMLVIRVPSEG